MKDSVVTDEGEDKAPVLISEDEYKSRYLTPSEIASLRQEFRDSENWIRKQLGLPECLTV